MNQTTVNTAEKPAAPGKSESSPAQHTAANGRAPAVADPPWFNAELFPGSSVTKTGRSPADDQGRFSSQMLFTLPEGAAIADCTEPLARAVEPVAPKLTREDKDGRVTLRGDATGGYEVIFVCGEVKGRMTAFVSYRWTQPPTAPER